MPSNIRARTKTRGVVAAGDPQTARAGAGLLDLGGNAVDAAVGAAFAAFVCELPLCSPLGGGVMLVSHSGGQPHALDLFARAPGLGGVRPSALDFVDVEVSFGATTQVFHVGRGSAAVPLALPGLLEAHRRWGSLPLDVVLSPAVELGTKGYVLGPGVAYVFQILTPIVERTPECRALFAHGDAIAPSGALLYNPDLAARLEELGKNQDRARDLYAALAREMGPSQGGLISEEDLRAASIVDAKPVRTRHAGLELATMPGPSTGGVLVALGLRLLDGVRKTAFLSREHVLAVARAQEALLGVRDENFDEHSRDPALVQALLDEIEIARLRAANQLGSTTHVSVLDEHGGSVALTLTNGEGNGHVLAGTGMVVNNLLGEEDIHPHGFHVDPPGRALSTMMAPTLLWRSGERIALGSGGSNRLRNAILQVLVGMVEHGVSAQLAVGAPRIQLDRVRDGEHFRLAFEAPGLAPEVVQTLLSAYPHAPVVFDARNLYFGGVHVAEAKGEAFDGAGDPRRGGAVVVV